MKILIWMLYHFPRSWKPSNEEFECECSASIINCLFVCIYVIRFVNNYCQIISMIEARLYVHSDSLQFLALVIAVSV
jgi:hypothetical protein